MVSHVVWKTWPSGLSYDKNLGLRPRFLSTESLGPCFSHGMEDHDQILQHKNQQQYHKTGTQCKIPRNSTWWKTQMGRPCETIIRIPNTNNKCFQDNKKLCARGQETNALLCTHILSYTAWNKNAWHCIQETNKKGTNKTEQSNKSAPQQKLVYTDHTTPQRTQISLDQRHWKKSMYVNLCTSKETIKLQRYSMIYLLKIKVCMNIILDNRIT